MKLILAVLFLSPSSCIFSQASVPFENKTQIYLIGAVDLDQIYYPCEEFTYLIDNSLLAQKDILSHLSDSLNLKYILINAPISFEYTYNKFLETDQKSNIWGPYYQQQKLKLYNEIQDQNELIRIKCYATNAYIEPSFLINVFFQITFNEPYKDSISPIQSFDPVIYKPYYMKAFKEKASNSNLQKIEFILDLYYNYGLTTGERKLSKMLYEGLLGISEDELNQLKIHLGNNYDYFCRLKESFLNEYSVSKFNKEKHADLRYQNLLNAIDFQSEDIYYVADDFVEVINLPEEKNLISQLEDENVSVNSVYIYSSRYSGKFEIDWINSYISDFFGMEKYYIHKIGVNKYLYCVTER